jgi:hypothetical protein
MTVLTTLYAIVNHDKSRALEGRQLLCDGCNTCASQRFRVTVQGMRKAGQLAQMGAWPAVSTTQVQHNSAFRGSANTLSTRTKRYSVVHGGMAATMASAIEFSCISAGETG